MEESDTAPQRIEVLSADGGCVLELGADADDSTVAATLADALRFEDPDEMIEALRRGVGTAGVVRHRP
jgi:hypothetical protein